MRARVCLAPARGARATCHGALRASPRRTRVDVKAVKVRRHCRLPLLCSCGCLLVRLRTGFCFCRLCIVDELRPWLSSGQRVMMSVSLVRASLPAWCTAAAAGSSGLRSRLRGMACSGRRVGVRCSGTTPPGFPPGPTPPGFPAVPSPEEVPGTARPPEEMPGTARPPQEMPGIDMPPEFNAPPGVDVPMPGAPVPGTPPSPEQPGPFIPSPPRPEIPAVPPNPDVIPPPPPEVDPPRAPPEVVPPQTSDVPPPFV
ncbi:vegetative cell wall protein gp1-like [Triticum aestivum]|uniref:vegetative cell wall protein gp1-like n=1 Tax=Triticum aestivum TaxID=4565 RepID=UPI001D0157DF|nr:vegetative cell wall protein gp1-like [Triticum aestivum]